QTVSEFALAPADTERLANLAGPFDAHLRLLELRLGVEIGNRGNVFRIAGPLASVSTAERVLRELWRDTSEEVLTEPGIHVRLGEAAVDRTVEEEIEPQEVAVRVKKGTIRGRGRNQAKYLHAIATHDINFGIGPAGTGKTFLSVAMAVEALNESRVQLLVLVRTAVKAGKKLRFLHGVLSKKVDPYLSPLDDVLYEMLGVDKVVKLLEKRGIVIGQLAYRRGRTLNHTFVILYEAQST